MKVKIKMNVPKPPTGIAGIIFFGACYKWKDVFYRMGEEYTVKKADFNPAIMVSLEPPKKKVVVAKVEEVEKVEKVEEATEAEVELKTSDEVPTETQKEGKQRKGLNVIRGGHEKSGVERRKKK